MCFFFLFNLREVENLLNCGADPNLVLQDGIAAIHLASGKESESALRCLTMILQKGGDPNVRYEILFIILQLATMYLLFLTVVFWNFTPSLLNCKLLIFFLFFSITSNGSLTN